MLPQKQEKHLIASFSPRRRHKTLALGNKRNMLMQRGSTQRTSQSTPQHDSQTNAFYRVHASVLSMVEGDFDRSHTRSHALAEDVW